MQYSLSPDLSRPPPGRGCVVPIREVRTCPAPYTPAGQLTSTLLSPLGGRGVAVKWLDGVYNLHGKTREVIPCRNAVTLFVAPSVQVRGLHASYIASISLHLFGNWIPKVSINPQEKCCVVCSDKLSNSKVIVRF